MRNLLAELWRLLGVAFNQTFRLLGYLNGRGRVLLRVILFWPLTYIVLALVLPKGIAITVIPLFALLPLLVLAYFYTKWPLLLVGAATAFPSTRKILRYLLALAAVGLAIGLVLAVVPIANDKRLGPAFVVALLIVLIPMTPVIGENANKKVKGAAFWGAAIIAVVLFLGGRDRVHRDAIKLRTEATLVSWSGGVTAPSGRPVCKDLTSYNFATNTGDEVDVILKGDNGCLGQNITLPASFILGFQASVIPAPDKGPISFAALCPNRGRVSVFYGPGATPGETLEDCDNPVAYGPLPSFIAGGHGIAVFRRNGGSSTGSSE